MQRALRTRRVSREKSMSSIRPFIQTWIFLAGLRYLCRTTRSLSFKLGGKRSRPPAVKHHLAVLRSHLVYLRDVIERVSTHPARLVLELTPREWKRRRQDSGAQVAAWTGLGVGHWCVVSRSQFAQDGARLRLLQQRFR